jgi:uncharacterized membrane protein YhaH (DUF805 family)
MKKYFYSNGQEKEGPVTLEELREIGVQPKTLIWYEGLDDWKEALNLDELKELFELTPPPLNSEINSANYQTDDDSLSNEQSNRSPKSLKKQSLFSNPFSFQGRIRRLEYGLSLIIFFFLLFGLEILLKLGIPFMLALARPVVLWFIIAQNTKRCHDLGRSGWYQIIPFYIFLLIFENGVPHRNKYGMNPKG